MNFEEETLTERFFALSEMFPEVVVRVSTAKMIYIYILKKQANIFSVHGILSMINVHNFNTIYCDDCLHIITSGFRTKR